MAENLKTTKYSSGDPISNVTDGTAWSNLTTGAYCDYNDSLGNSTTYGKLYNWYTVADSRNVCPTGWHVSTDVEWTTLITYLGGELVAGGKLKENCATNWQSPNTGATNATGFTALPGGYRYDDGTFQSIGYSGFWWSSTAFDTSAWYQYMYHNYTGVLKSYFNLKPSGFSVRCVMD
jgi:uncharacterized protein (TIGR02145 family)